MDLIDAPRSAGPIGLIVIGLYLAVAVALSLGLEALVNRLWRAGLDAQRHLGGMVVLVKMLLALGFGALLAASAVIEFARGHVFQSVVTLLLFLLGAVSIGRDLVGCAVLTFSAKVRIGDRMQVGELSGTVREIGILQTHLRDAAGTKLVVPNREFLISALQIAKTKHSVPLTLRIAAPGIEASPLLLQRIRTLLLLCPFRSAHSAVHARLRAGELELHLEVWSPNALLLAEQQIGAGVQRIFAGGLE